MDKFTGGQIVMTSGVAEAVGQLELGQLLRRHFNGDWGLTCIEDCGINDQAIAHEGNKNLQDRVMSVYRTDGNETVWVITEWDRSSTTILYPSEY